MCCAVSCQQQEQEGVARCLRVAVPGIGSSCSLCCDEVPKCGPGWAVKTPKHGLQGLGQHDAMEAQREEMALLMAPSEGQTGQHGAMLRNAC
jgi:hypothetical protein